MSESGRDEGEYDAEGHDGDIGVSPSPSHRPARRSSFTDTNGMADLRVDMRELRHIVSELATTVRHLAATTQSPAPPSPQRSSFTPRATGLRMAIVDTSLPMCSPPAPLGEGSKQFEQVVRIEISSMKQHPFNPDGENANVGNFYKRLMAVLYTLGHKDGQRRPEPVRDRQGNLTRTAGDRAIILEQEAYDRMSYACLIAIRNSVEEKSSLGRQLALCSDHESALTHVRALLSNAEGEAKTAARDFLNLQMASPSAEDVGIFFAQLYTLDTLAQNAEGINWTDSFRVEHIVRAAEKHKPFRLLGEMHDGLTAEERATSAHFANVGVLHRRIMTLAKKHDAIEDSYLRLRTSQRGSKGFYEQAYYARTVRDRFRAMAATLGDLGMSLEECLATGDDKGDDSYANDDLETFFAQHLVLEKDEYAHNVTV